MAVTIDASRALGPQFFREQDRIRGGPAEALCTPDYSAQIGGTPVTDLAGHQLFAKMFYAGLPDAKHTIEDVIAEPDKVAVRFMINGTHTGDFMGIPPTGHPIAVRGIAMLTIRDGKVAQLRAVFDQFGLMQQMGVIGTGG